MDLREHQNLFALWGYSFIVALQTWWQVIVVGIVWFVAGQIVELMLKESLVFLSLPVLLAPGSGKLGVVIGLCLVFFTIAQFFSCYFWSAWMHLLNRVINQKKPSVLEAFARSFGTIWPLFVLGFLVMLLSLPAFLISLPGILFEQPHPALGIFLGLVLFFAVFIRWTYAPGYIFLQERGGLDSMGASWEFTRTHYLETIALWAIVAITYFFCMIFLVVIAKLLSLLFTDKGSFLFVFGVPFVAIFSLMFSQILAFILVVCANRENVVNPRMTAQEAENWAPIELDLSELESDDNNFNTAPDPNMASISDAVPGPRTTAAPNPVVNPNTSSKPGTMDVIE